MSYQQIQNVQYATQTKKEKAWQEDPKGGETRNEKKKKNKYCDTVNHFAIATYPIWYAIALSRLVAATHVSAQKKLRPPTTIAT